MANQAELEAFVTNAKHNIKCLLNEASVNILYHKVKMKRGKYRGRKASITSIIVDNNHGLLFYCAVYKKRSETEFMDSHADDRSFWPAEAFELI